MEDINKIIISSLIKMLEALEDETTQVLYELGMKIILSKTRCYERVVVTDKNNQHIFNYKKKGFNKSVAEYAMNLN